MTGDLPCTLASHIYGSAQSGRLSDDKLLLEDALVNCPGGCLAGAALRNHGLNWELAMRDVAEGCFLPFQLLENEHGVEVLVSTVLERGYGNARPAFIQARW